MQTSACTQKAARFGETTCRPSFPPPFASPRQEASPGNLLSLGLVPRHGSGFSQKQRAGTPGSQPTKRRRTAAHRGLRASPPPPATRTTPRSPGGPRVSPPPPPHPCRAAPAGRRRRGRAAPARPSAAPGSASAEPPWPPSAPLLAGTGRGARWDAESGGCRPVRGGALLPGSCSGMPASVSPAAGSCFVTAMLLPQSLSELREARKYGYKTPSSLGSNSVTCQTKR